MKNINTESKYSKMMDVIDDNNLIFKDLDKISQSTYVKNFNNIMSDKEYKGYKVKLGYQKDYNRIFIKVKHYAEKTWTQMDLAYNKFRLTKDGESMSGEYDIITQIEKLSILTDSNIINNIFYFILSLRCARVVYKDGKFEEIANIDEIMEMESLDKFKNFNIYNSEYKDGENDKMVNIGLYDQAIYYNNYQAVLYCQINNI